MHVRTILPLALILSLLCASTRALAEPQPPMKKPANPEAAAFCIDLYKQLAAEKGNLFFSPFSIVTALAMTSAGAAGPTDAEMARVLHLDLDPAKRHAECASWARALDTAGDGLFKRPGGGLETSTANALWCASQISFKKPFVTIATKEYQAEVRALDFKRNPDKAVDAVNDWVDDKTHGKIKKILTPDAVNAATALILTNAIYFKGDWAEPFKKESTRDMDFTLEGGSKIQCPTMVQGDPFNYAKREDFAVLEMPYKGGRMSMVILLPNQIDGLPQLEKKLNVPLLNEAMNEMNRQKIIAYLPKFHAETRYQLSDYLQKMGMRMAFSQKEADFSGMTDDQPLFISSVIHKAFVDVDEKGTEPAAATAVTMEVGSARPTQDPPIFRADHAFMYLIRDTQSGQILFAGRMADPRK